VKEFGSKKHGGCSGNFGVKRGHDGDKWARKTGLEGCMEKSRGTMHSVPHDIEPSGPEREGTMEIVGQKDRQREVDGAGSVRRDL